MIKKENPENLINNKHNLVRKTAVYFGASILNQVLNLFLIPIYTKNFSPALFGEFTIVLSLQGILSFFVSLGLFSGLSRFYYETDQPLRLKNIAVSFCLFWGLLIIGACMLSAPVIAPLLFGANPNGPGLIRLIALNSFCLCLINIYKTYMTMKYQAFKSSMVSLLNLLLAMILTIYLVAVVKKGVIGALQAQVIAAAVVVGGLFLADFRKFHFDWDKMFLTKMLTYGVGLLPGQLGCWVLMLVDRYFLKEMIDLSTVGVYSMGYKIGVLVQPLLLIPLKNIFTPLKFEVYQATDGRAKIERIFSLYNFIGWLVILGLALFAAPALKLLATKAYGPAYTIVPLIALAYYVLSLGEFYSLGIHIANLTMIDSWVVIGGALADVVLNYLLVPIWGMYGAAVAVLVAYLGMIICYYFLSKKYYRLGINFKLPGQYALICIGIYAGYYYLKPKINHLGWELLLSAGLCLLFVAISYVAGLIPRAVFEICGQIIAKARSGLGIAAKAETSGADSA